MSVQKWHYKRILKVSHFFITEQFQTILHVLSRN